MKEIKKTEQAVIVLPSVSTRAYYGAQFKRGSKAFITCETFQTNFTLRSDNLLTEGNGWSNYTNRSLKVLICNLIDNNIKVIEFDTSKELLAWLIED